MFLIMKLKTQDLQFDIKNIVLVNIEIIKYKS